MSCVHYYSKVLKDKRQNLLGLSRGITKAHIVEPAKSHSLLPVPMHMHLSHPSHDAVTPCSVYSCTCTVSGQALCGDSSPSKSIAQSSQIVSRSKSALLSPPQILHLFLPILSAPLPSPKPPLRDPGISRLLLLRGFSPSLLSSSAIIRALRSRSASIAWHSRSGASSIVSSDEIEGERERAEVGVLGMLLKEELLA